jgi:hypothetical protein
MAQENNQPLRLLVLTAQVLTGKKHIDEVRNDIEDALGQVERQQSRPAPITHGEEDEEKKRERETFGLGESAQVGSHHADPPPKPINRDR